jgi:hypothetical protein
MHASGAYFEFKKRYVSLIFKKISPKTFRPHCIFLVWFRCIEHQKF